MKTNLLSFLTLLVLSFLTVNAGYAQGFFCENFNAGLGTWQGLNADVTISSNSGGSYLDINDSGGESWVLNTGYDHHTVGCGEISYDYHLKDDAEPGANNVANQIMLISNAQSPWTQQRATFVLFTPINENTGIINITVPIHPIAPGDPLPSNAQGSWQMQNPAQWNNLVSSFVGVAFFVDLIGSSSQNENFHLDNFCYVPAPNVNFALEVKTDCISGVHSVSASGADQEGYTYSWRLFQTTLPGQTSGGVQVGTTQTGPSVTFTGTNALNYYYVVMTITDICQDVHVVTAVVPYHLIESIFHFEDEFGNPQTTFCYGEDVFLDGAASFGENNYWIGVSRRPYPNTGQGWQNWADVSWTPGQVPNAVNLSAAFAAINYDFEPGWEYNIKLAVQNVPECVNWVETVHSFVVECCDDFLDAKFDLERKAVTGTDLFALIAVEYNGYANADVTHTWTVYSSPNLDGGPYTLVTEITDDEFYYEVEEGLCYFVVHSLKTLCGEWCFGQSDCINAGESLEKELCDLCGPIDCKLLDELCLAPTNIKNKCIGFNPVIQRLDWDPMLGTAGYVVEITWNDPACCSTALPPFTFEYAVAESHLDLNFILQPEWKCLRWRVRAVCDKVEPAWSEYKCFYGCGPHPVEKELDDSADLPASARLYPNPTTGLVHVGFDEAFSGTLQLTDKLGRPVQAQTVTNTLRATFDLSALPNGLYWIVSKNEIGTQTYKLIKQE